MFEWKEHVDAEKEERNSFLPGAEGFLSFWVWGVGLVAV
jgi:hypothetical protein